MSKWETIDTVPKDGTLKVWSGDCCLCDVGLDTGHGFKTGDIVLLWKGEHIDTDNERWEPLRNLTVVVADQYTTYSNGKIEETESPEFYVMGIRDCGFDDPSWDIWLVKDHSDVVTGEHWRDYGFSFRQTAMIE
jgi:hypothetical protein